MNVTKLDKYKYIVTKPVGKNSLYFSILIDSEIDPLISDIESSLIDTEFKIFAEGGYHTISRTFIRKIGSATMLVLEEVKEDD